MTLWKKRKKPYVPKPPRQLTPEEALELKNELHRRIQVAGGCEPLPPPPKAEDLRTWMHQKAPGIKAKILKALFPSNPKRKKQV